MEALTKLGIDWKLLLAQAVNFLVLLWVLKRYAYGPILRALEARTKRIEQGLRDATASKERLSAVHEEGKQIVAVAREEAREILLRSEETAKKRDASMLSETKAKIDRMIAETDAHLAEKQATLLREAKAEIAEVVLLATKRILNERVTVSVDEELVERSLNK